MKQDRLPAEDGPASRREAFMGTPPGIAVERYSVRLNTVNSQPFVALTLVVL